MSSVQDFRNLMNGKTTASFQDFCFIFAVNTSATSSQEMEYIKARLGHLAKIKQVEGSWDGKREVSYAVFPRYDSFESYKFLRHAVLNLASIHKQQSILILSPRDENGRREASLHWLNINTTQEVGHFVPATAEEAMKQQGWTRDGNNFFVIK